MLINGEKWACEACVRGHRVSNCQHSDRPLQHINKKGRPVSQCVHCRTMRKARTSHVKCDCGEKSHRCPHVKTTAVDGHKDGCCCNHGGRCTCSHKKEFNQLDPVQEFDSDNESTPRVTSPSQSGSRARRRASTLDGRRSSTTTPRTSFATARKSKSYQNDYDELSKPDHLGGDNSPMSSNGSPHEQRKADSECGSPLMTGSSSFTQARYQPPQLDMTRVAYSANAGDFFGSLSDQEQPLYSAGLSSASVDWSLYDGLDFAPTSYSQPQSYVGYDVASYDQPPTLTTSTSISGETSELEDFMPSSFDELNTSGTFQPGAFSFGNTSRPDYAVPDYDEDFRLAKAATIGNNNIGLTNAAADIGDYQLTEDDPGFWMGSETLFGVHGLPVMSDTYEPGMASVWEAQ